MCDMNLTDVLVVYALTEADATKINQTRGLRQIAGNAASAGDTYPAVVVRSFGETSNLKVLLDGEDALWVTSVKEGAGLGEFARAVVA